MEANYPNSNPSACVGVNNGPMQISISPSPIERARLAQLVTITSRRVMTCSGGYIHKAIVQANAAVISHER